MGASETSLVTEAGASFAVVTNTRISELLGEERRLRYERPFTSFEALRLGSAIARLSTEYDRGVGVKVTRESDGLVIFQWMADDKADRYFRYLDGKRLAALGCGHSSLYAEALHEADGSFGEMYAEGAPEWPGAGAFPIRVGDEWVATVSVSGLHEGKDHELVVRALEECVNNT